MDLSTKFGTKSTTIEVRQAAATATEAQMDQIRTCGRTGELGNEVQQMTAGLCRQAVLPSVHAEGNAH